MADAELVERIARWCAEAWRQAGNAEIRRALAPLTWDQLLAVRALLADPPPARPLGPLALADIARGVPPDLAAEREREGRYRGDEQEGEDGPAGAPAVPASVPPRTRASRQRTKRAGIVIRRARDRSPAAPDPVPAPPSLSELFRPEGRAVIERLMRRHGARRPALTAAIAAGWARDAAAAEVGDALSRLLDHHGLSRKFERRERDELLHALRAERGLRVAAAARAGLEPDAFDAALARLGASADAERIRAERRAELRARATLSARVRLLLGDEPRLRDLGLLPEFEEDLRARLPEHVRALRTARTPVAVALGRSLSLTEDEARALTARFGLDVRGPARAVRGATPASTAAPPAREPRPRSPGSDRPGRGEKPLRSAPAAGARRGARPERDEKRPRSAPTGGPRRGAPPQRGTRPARRPGPPRRGPR